MAIRLKSRNHSPIGGFIVDVPEISNTARTFWDFSTAANALWDLLQANPGITRRFPHLPQSRAACDDYVDSRNAQRMMTIPSGNTYVAQESPVPKTQPAVSRVAQGSARLAAGASTIAEMFGPEGPTTKEQAIKRSEICVECPKNTRTGDWASWFTGPASLIIRKWLGIVKDLDLTTPNDSKVHYCTACSCPLKVKLFARKKHIEAHMPAEVRAGLPGYCWILAEK